MARQRTRTSAPVEVAPTIAQLQPNIQAVMNDAAKQYGEHTVTRATAMPGYTHIETGIFALDVALLGGIVEGQSTLVYGWAGAGKTTLCKRVAAFAQRKYPNRSVLFVDLEQAYNAGWGAKHGIDNERLIVVRPPTGEAAVDLIAAMIQTGEISVIIVDSLPTLVPFKEGEESAEDAQYAARSRLVARLCSKIGYHGNETRKKYGHTPTVLMINQWRSKIGGPPKANPNTLPCGNQQHFHCTTKIDIRNREILKNDGRGLEIVSHNEHSFKIDKSRAGNSARNGVFEMIRDPGHPLGEGAIDDAGLVVSMAKKFGLISGGGSAWRIDGNEEKFGKLEQITAYYNENPDEALDMKRRLLMVLRMDMGLPALPPDQYLLGYCALEE